jgi:hypothetical protein
MLPITFLLKLHRLLKVRYNVRCTAHNAGMTFCKFTNGQFILVYILPTIWPSFGPLYSVDSIPFFMLLKQAKRQWMELIRS